MKSIVRWLAIGMAFVVIGAMVGVMGMTALGWDFLELDPIEITPRNAQFGAAQSSTVNRIVVTDLVTNLQLVPSANDQIEFDYFETEKMSITVSIVEDALHIVGTDKRKWYDHVSIFMFNGLRASRQKPVLRLPAGVTYTLDILMTNGDISIDKLDLATAMVVTRNGDIKCTQTSANKLQLQTHNGNIQLQNLDCTLLEAGTHNGQINAKSVSAREFEAQTSNGDIDLADIRALRASVQTNNGEIEARGMDAEESSFVSHNGDIEVSVLGDSNQYKYVLKTHNGDIHPKGSHTPSGYTRTVTITTYNGDIELKFGH